MWRCRGSPVVRGVRTARWAGVSRTAVKLIRLVRLSVLTACSANRVCDGRTAGDVGGGQCSGSCATWASRVRVRRHRHPARSQRAPRHRAIPALPAGHRTIEGSTPTPSPPPAILRKSLAVG
jgi:hypothetical protein